MLSSRPTYDVRNRALVEFSGDVAEHETLQEALSVQGWKIIKSWSVLGSQQRTRNFYILEIRFLGSRFGVDRGTRKRLERFGDVHSLNLAVCGPEESEYLNIISGASHVGENLEEIKKLLEPPGGRGENWRRRDIASRQLMAFLVGVAAWVMIFGSVAIVEISVLAGILVVVALCAQVSCIRWAVGILDTVHRRRRFWRLMLLAFLSDWFGVGYGLAQHRDSLPLWIIPSFIAAGLIAAGLRLEVRQASWRAVLSWLIPVVITVVFAVFPQFSVVWTASYLHHFGVDADEVSASPENLLGGASGLFGLIVCLLAVPAVLGTIRHFHVGFTDDRQHAASYVALLLLVVFGWLAFLQISSFREANAAKAYASDGRSPAAFYSVTPKLICVIPLEKPADLPGDGPMLNPAVSHLYFGTKDGMAVLWSPADGQKVTVPAQSVRLIEVEKRRCTITTYAFLASDFERTNRLDRSGKEKAENVIQLVRERGVRQISVYSEPARGGAGNTWSPARLDSLADYLSAELGQKILIVERYIDRCDVAGCPEDPQLTVVVPGVA
ncbi:hypothetical protein QF035_005603 [Streptomyces umbrinus]|uniref:Uncharacterized protein n=1 Tax=Streptomyces umbrinus TaxID=67370 RepID=A0ABU0SWT9_9ACTN|nr:hypothetical protein [Streptomyces umbrinus]MDQ1028021.1 hypothetical protein [Streptomyces umbrinus]